MAGPRNIVISAQTIPLTPEILELYDNYIKTTDNKIRDGYQKALEHVFAKTYGAKVVGGSQKLVPDFKVRDIDLVSELSRSTPFQPEDSGELNIEAKIKRTSRLESQTGIGGSRLSGSFLEELKGARIGLKKSAGSLDTMKYLSETLKIPGGRGLFDFLAKKAPILHAQAYNKAKNLSIYTKTGGSAIVYQIYFPKSKWNSSIFGANYSSTENSGSIGYFLYNSFEQKLKETVQDRITEVWKNNFDDAVKRTKSTSITFGKAKATERITVEWLHTNSIPMAEAVIQKTKQAENAKESFTSVVDITEAVSGRVKMRMARGSGKPRPPKIHERTGNFRSSITAFANFRTNAISYYYEPKYDSLQKYGYEINELVEGSIRAIAQKKFNQQFNLRRTNA